MMLNIRILFGNLIIYYYIHYRKNYFIQKNMVDKLTSTIFKLFT